MRNRRIIALGIAALATLAAATFHLPSATAAPAVFGLRYMASSGTSTSVSWFKAEQAVTYNVYANGALVRTVTDPQLTTTIELPQLLGPKDSVRTEAVAADGSTGAMMTATYRYLYPPYDVFLPAARVDFGIGSADLDAAALADVTAFVAMMRAHGFGEILIRGHNAVRAGTFNGLTMAALRADHVAGEIAAAMVIPTTTAVHGDAVGRTGAGTPATRQVELLFR